MVLFSRWIAENAANTAPPMTVLDTSNRSIDETVERVANWILCRLP